MTGSQTSPSPPEALSKRLATKTSQQNTILWKIWKVFGYRWKSKIYINYGGNFLMWILFRKVSSIVVPPSIWASYNWQPCLYLHVVTHYSFCYVLSGLFTLCSKTFPLMKVSYSSGWNLSLCMNVCLWVHLPHIYMHTPRLRGILVLGDKVTFWFKHYINQVYFHWKTTTAVSLMIPI